MGQRNIRDRGAAPDLELGRDVYEEQDGFPKRRHLQLRYGEVSVLNVEPSWEEDHCSTTVFCADESRRLYTETMLFLGLTGGIGAGKSTVSAELERLGAVIVDADKIAREVVAPGTPGLDLLAAEFGEEIITVDGELDRPKLAQIAFASPERTAALNAITHPLIGERTFERIANAPQDGIVVHDMPLLLESTMQAGYHLTLVVDAPRELRTQRLVEFRGLDADDVRNRMDKQVSDEVRHAEADILFDNTGTPEQLVAQVREAWDVRLVRMNHNLNHRHAVHGSAEIIAYRPQWPAEARRAAARLTQTLGHLAASVTHTGMTAEQGMPAADVIELTVIPSEGISAGQIVERLDSAGYIKDEADAHLLRWVDPVRPLEIRVVHSDEKPLAGVAEAADPAEDAEARD